MRIIRLDCCCQWYTYLKWTGLLNVWWHIMSHISLYLCPPPPTIVSSENEDLQSANTTSTLCRTFLSDNFFDKTTVSFQMVSVPGHLQVTISFSYPQLHFEDTGCSLIKEGGGKGSETREEVMIHTDKREHVAGSACVQGVGDQHTPSVCDFLQYSRWNCAFRSSHSNF